MALKKSKIIGDFRDMIRLRTISCEDMSQAPLDQFEAFRELLRERFPALFGAAEVRYPASHFRRILSPSVKITSNTAAF